MTASLRVLLYALVAATSPLALGATAVVLSSARGRLNGTAFAIGALLGQSIVWVILVLVGSSWVPADHDRSTLFLVLELAFGVALLVAAAHVRRTPTARRAGSGQRVRAFQERLRRLSPGTALGTGVLLGFGGPKRLGVTVLAAATIAAAQMSRSSDVALALTYVLIATALVWVPTLLYLVFDQAATDRIAQAERWISEHRAHVVFWPSVVVGLVLVIDAVVTLLTD